MQKDEDSDIKFILFYDMIDQEARNQAKNNDSLSNQHQTPPPESIDQKSTYKRHYHLQNPKVNRI